MMRRTIVLFITMTIGVVLAGGMAVAAVLSFSNPSQILINDAVVGDNPPSPADPYPSEISVSGFSGTIRDVNLTLKSFTHRFPDDVGVLLVGPQGQNALLMSDSGSGFDVVGLRLILDDEATNSLPDLPADGPITSGTYKPTQGTNGITDGCPVPADFPFPPAPASPYGTTLSEFDGTDPNGIWQLYVVDDCDKFKGKIRGGWSLRIKAEVL
jgi:subtilisin-like proprotein convertase family protein